MIITIFITAVVCVAICASVFIAFMRKYQSFEAFEDHDKELAKKILMELDNDIKQEIKFNTEMKNKMTQDTEAFHFYKGRAAGTTIAHRKIDDIYRRYFGDYYGKNYYN